MVIRVLELGFHYSVNAKKKFFIICMTKNLQGVRSILFNTVTIMTVRSLADSDNDEDKVDEDFLKQ